MCRKDDYDEWMERLGQAKSRKKKGLRVEGYRVFSLGKCIFLLPLSCLGLSVIANICNFFPNYLGLKGQNNGEQDDGRNNIH